MTTNRVYAVYLNGKERLVRASNKSQAVGHVARDTITAEVADQDTLIAAIAAGVPVETAGAAE